MEKYTLANVVVLVNSLVEKCNKVQKDQNIPEAEREKAKAAQTHLDSAKDVLDSWSKVLGEDVKLSRSINELYVKGQGYDSLGPLTNDNFVEWAREFNCWVMNCHKTRRFGESNVVKGNQKPKRSRRYIIIIIITGILLSALVALSIVSFFLLPKDERNLYSLSTMLVGILDFICGIIFFIYGCKSDKNKALTANGDNAPSERTYSKGQKRGAYCCAVVAFVLSLVALVMMLILVFKPFQIQYENAQPMWAWSCISNILSLIFVAFGVFLLKRGTGVQIFVWVTVVVCIFSIALQYCFKPVEARNDIVEYIANEDGTAYQAVIIPQDVETDYVIAANYDGKPITSIGRKDPEKPLYIKSLDIGANITTIGDEAFAHSRGLTKITLPQNVNEMGERAFYDSVDLVYVTVNCNLTKVGNEVFDKCNALSTVWWNCNGDSVGFGDIFVSCESIRTVILGHSINSIAANMFNNCKSIEEVVLYENIRSIGNGAFANCDSLQSVFYRGNADQWQYITVGRDCQSLMSAQIYYYNQQEPQLSNDGLSYEGNWWHSDDSGLPVVWKYTPPTYTVKFYADGKLYKVITYTKNDTDIEEPTVPIKKGYTGVWEKYTLNNSDIAVNAVYTAKTYTLNFDYNQADGGIIEDCKTVIFDQPIGDLPNPTKTNFTFKGWYIEDVCIDSEFVWNLDGKDMYTARAEFFVDGDAKNYFGGLGTADAPYLISTRQHFENIKNKSTSHFKLMNDIDLGIWSTPFAFAGHIDGQNYTIKYVQTIKPNTNPYYAGLFTTISGTNIENLIVDCNIQAEDFDERLYVGGLAGYAIGVNTISKVCTQGEIVISTEDGNDYMAGLFGAFEGGIIDQCCNLAKLEDSAFASRVGGIVSFCSAESTHITISNCYNTGSIKARTGYIFGGRSASGIVSQAKGQDVFKLTISNCYNDSSVKIEQYKNAAMGWWACGGLLGDITGKSTNIFIERSYWNKKKTTLGGNSKNYHQDNGVDAIVGTFDGWSADIWQFDNDCAPQLKWLSEVGQ